MMMRIVHISEPEAKKPTKGQEIHIAAVQALAIVRAYDRIKASKMFKEEREEVYELQNKLKALSNEVQK